MSKSEAIEQVLRARQQGLSLRRAAALAGVHVSTVCRWQARDAALRQALAEAARAGWRARYRPRKPRPPVPWRRDCPWCRAGVVVRTAGVGLRFWRCGRWPDCPWASWRPRAPGDCQRCGRPCFWSYSRKSIGCSGCGLRFFTP